MKKKKLDLAGETISRYHGNDEAFPRPSTESNCGAPGVDLLGHFAGLAMQGFAANPAYADKTVEWTARAAVYQARALISALNEHVEK